MNNDTVNLAIDNNSRLEKASLVLIHLFSTRIKGKSLTKGKFLQLLGMPTLLSVQFGNQKRSQFT